jgi:hypothetical protein
MNNNYYKQNFKIYTGYWIGCYTSLNWTIQNSIPWESIRAIIITLTPYHQLLYSVSWFRCLTLSSICYTQNEKFCFRFHILFLHTWTNYMRRVIFENLTMAQLFKKFPAFYGTRVFITLIIKSQTQNFSWCQHPASPMYIREMPERSILFWFWFQVTYLLLIY